jgi:hypothetical protein
MHNTVQNLLTDNQSLHYQISDKIANEERFNSFYYHLMSVILGNVLVWRRGQQRETRNFVARAAATSTQAEVH